jgi:hypothetical protein
MRKEERKKAQEVEKEAALLDEHKKDMKVWEKCAALRTRKESKNQGEGVCVI